MTDLLTPTVDAYGRDIVRPLHRTDSAVALVLSTSAKHRIYTEVAPSGVRVVSAVPFVVTRWWDSPWLHLVWSWTSWTAQVLNAFGHPGLKRWFNKHWTRKAHPEPKTDWTAWKKAQHGA